MDTGVGVRAGAVGLVGAPPPGPAGSLLSLGFLPALHTWEFSPPLLRDSQGDLHSQDSNPGSSSIRGLLPLVNRLGNTGT